MKAVILAGGLGSRIEAIAGNKPKALLEIGGKPIVEHQIHLLKRHHITDIIMLVSYKSDMIEAYLRDGHEFGVNLHYIKEDIPLGTAGSVKAAEKAIGSDNFLVIYGDVMVDMDLTQLCRFSNSVKGVGTIVVHPNTHPHDSDLIEIDSTNKVIAIHAKPHNENQYYQNLVNAGVYVFTNKIFEHIKPDIKSDFGRDIFTQLVSKGAELYGYRTAEYIKDMGTPERLDQVRADYRSDKVSRLI